MAYIMVYYNPKINQIFRTLKILYTLIQCHTLHDIQALSKHSYESNKGTLRDSNWKLFSNIEHPNWKNGGGEYAGLLKSRCGLIYCILPPFKNSWLIILPHDVYKVPACTQNYFLQFTILCSSPLEGEFRSFTKRVGLEQWLVFISKVISKRRRESRRPNPSAYFLKMAWGLRQS